MRCSDILRGTGHDGQVILTALKNGDVRWTVLEKKVLTTCRSLATRTRFDNRLTLFAEEAVYFTG